MYLYMVFKYEDSFNSIKEPEMTELELIFNNALKSLGATAQEY